MKTLSTFVAVGVAVACCSVASRAQAQKSIVIDDRTDQPTIDFGSGFDTSSRSINGETISFTVTWKAASDVPGADRGAEAAWFSEKGDPTMLSDTLILSWPATAKGDSITLTGTFASGGNLGPVPAEGPVIVENGTFQDIPNLWRFRTPPGPLPDGITISVASSEDNDHAPDGASTALLTAVSLVGIVALRSRPQDGIRRRTA